MTPLSDEQQSAVHALVTARRIEAVPVDDRRAAAFIGQARDRLEELGRMRNPAIKFGVAYDAAHDVGEALLAAYGYRTRSGAGQHEALGRFLKAVLVTPPGDRAANQFDRLRRARNRDHYGAQPVGVADTARAERAAADLLAAALDLGVPS
ncbi:hypothetical protein [Schumannella sp. 10F1B-5-1]|uniref:hypothetical protein n=1 Tax=Schumannella sp. 10F1B-5-1 TaxID=2590780 RepID=UPI00112FF01B|nr:hypothetical protein [Schumannella sp. 10F1B-5-1]TPW76994.1 hypothetical protein FJ658_03505 [Schumannella sp. 10F1B-5-1]